MAGPEGQPQRVLPASVLFVCNLNAVRSPMAEVMLKKLHGSHIFVDSVGVAPAEEADPFTAEVLREAGLVPPSSGPKGFDDLDDMSFDLIIALTPEAAARAEEITRGTATEVESWTLEDPLAAPTGGSRERRLIAYRELRDKIARLVADRFSQG